MCGEPLPSVCRTLAEVELELLQLPCTVSSDTPQASVLWCPEWEGWWRSMLQTLWPTAGESDGSCPCTRMASSLLWAYPHVQERTRDAGPFVRGIVKTLLFPETTTSRRKRVMRSLPPSLGESWS